MIVFTTEGTEFTEIKHFFSVFLVPRVVNDFVLRQLLNIRRFLLTARFAQEWFSSVNSVPSVVKLFVAKLPGTGPCKTSMPSAF